MLSRVHRLTTSRGFAETVRRGRRAGSRSLVLHLRLAADRDAGAEPLVGFVVSKAVGNAVTRNLVKRRLRHLVRQRLTSLPGRGVLVVRALPAAGSASFAELDADFDACLGRLLRRTGSS